MKAEDQLVLFEIALASKDRLQLVSLALVVHLVAEVLDTGQLLCGCKDHQTSSKLAYRAS